MQSTARRSERLLSNAFRSLPSSTLASPAPLSPAFRPLSQPLQRRHRWFSSSQPASATTEPNKPTGEEKLTAEEEGVASYDGAASQATTSGSAAGKAEQANPAAAMEEKHKEELRQLKHQLLTSMADLQNLQKRKEADVKQAKEFAISKFANDVVSDLDVLTLALTSVPAEARTSDGPIKALFEGVSLTASTLERTLKRHGVISFDPTGDVFDPNVHEATFIVPMPGKKPNTIFDCQKKGWKIGTRILRAPQVGVVAEQPK